MTEAEWLACTAPTTLLRKLGDRLTSRKVRLFGCACCRRVWDYLSDERWRTAVLVAERYAEGQATDAELAHAYKKAGRDLSWDFRFTDAGVQQAAVRWLTRAVDETNGDDPFWGADRRPLVQLAVNVDAHTRMVAASQRDQRRRPPPAPRPTDTR